MKSLSAKTFQCGVTVQGLTTLSGTVYLTALTNTATWDYVVVGTTAQGQLYTRTYAQLMSDITSGIGLSGYVPTSRTLTINGVSYDLTANRSWTISTVDYTSRLQHQVKAGVAINKGQAVYVTSADGTNMIVGLASNASEATSSKTMGLLDATVSINGFANVVTEGLLAGLDTSAAGTEGDPVWLGTGGNLIYGLINKPYAPAHLVFIGIVTRKNSNNGEIFVKVQNGFELNEIHDVDLKTNLPTAGQLLRYDSDGLWKNWSPNYLTAEADTLASVTSRGSSTSTPVTFNGNVTLGNSADLVFQDLAGTFPTSGKGFDWTLNNDGARIYAIQPNSDSIDFVFQLRDNATTNDRFVFWVDEWQGPAFDKYPLIISGGTEFDLKDSSLYTNTVLRLSNSGVLQNVTGNISMFTNNVGYLTSETDTLSTVTGRGATTSTNISVNTVILGTDLTYGGVYRSVSFGTNSDSYNRILAANNTSDGMYFMAATGQGFNFRPNGGTANLVVINSSGSVGIGTTTPSQKLDVNGYAKFTSGIILDGGATSHYREFIWNTSGFNRWDLYVHGAEPGSNVGGDLFLARYADNGAYLANAVTFQRSTGNVGIGTTSPNYKLHVSGNVYINETLFVNQLTTVEDSLIVYDNLGIGTTSPQSKLHVAAANDRAALRLQNTAAAKVWEIIPSVPGVTNAGLSIFNVTDGTVPLYVSDSGNVGIGVTSPTGKLQIADDGPNALVLGSTQISTIGETNDGGYPGMKIVPYNSNIHIGISSTNDNKINLWYGGSNYTYWQQLSTYSVISNYSTNALVFQVNGGNVGIGTTSPGTALAVNGGTAGQATVHIQHTSASGYSGIDFYENTGTHVGSLWHANSAGVGSNQNAMTLAARTSGDKVYIVAGGYDPTTSGGITVDAGNVGIGTTAPTNRLQIGSTGSSGYGGNDLVIGNGTQVMAFYQSATVSIWYTNTSFSLMSSGSGSVGNVGIGTLTPSTKLDVSGVITATGGNSTNWNTAYGWGNHASASYVPQARTLTINGTSYDLSANRSWTIATTTPGGADTQFQYNSSGSLAGASALTYNSTTNRVGINQASPGYDLDVNGQVRVQDKLRVGTVNSGNGVVHMSSSATINPSATTIVWAQNVSVGMCAFIEYYILNNNSLTDQRAGTIMVTWNQSGTPTIAHTETTTPDIGSTTTVNFTSSLVGSDARINAVNSSANPYTIVMSYKYF